MSVNSSTFPVVLKSADVTPVYKKDSRYLVLSVINVLPNLSVMFENIAPYFEKHFSKYQTGFRNGFNPETCLEVMIEKLWKSPDEGGEYAALLTDLFKAFDCLSHDLLILKLHVYGFDMPSVRIMHSYLTDRYQRVKINNTVSGA